MLHVRRYHAFQFAGFQLMVGGDEVEQFDDARRVGQFLPAMAGPCRVFVVFEVDQGGGDLVGGEPAFAESFNGGGDGAIDQRFELVRGRKRVPSPAARTMAFTFAGTPGQDGAG